MDRKPGRTLETTGMIASPDLADAETLPAAAPGTRLTVGERIGRFTVSGLLGTGGMGEVYAATDPELDRKIAIKLLRAEKPTRADIRLRREARAMARLSHPNLVTVHEVGVHEGQVFVAMELIDGQTLRTWVRSKPWRDVVRAYITAGRGLAAAHDAGIVHRDFKPDNVLVGRDGRVAVGDFGLARTGDDDPEPDRMKFADDKVTQDGALIGTLRYMAPEQLERRTADARSDQFSFCIALWEALDDHPFDSVDTPGTSSAEERRDAIRAGLARRRMPRVSSGVSRVLARGLADDPGERWPSMTVLLDALDRALGRRRRVATVAVLAGIIAAAATVTWLLGSMRTLDDPCAHVGDRVAQIWQGPRGFEQLANAFRNAPRRDGSRLADRGVPHVDETARLAGEILDRYAQAWHSMRVDSCQANARGDQSPQVYDARTRCLDQRLVELAETVERLTHEPTADTVSRAVRAASRLRRIDDCSNVEALLDRPAPPPDPATRARVDAVAEELARLVARERVGAVIDEATLADVARRASELGRDELIADAKYLVGHAAYIRGDAELANAALMDAAFAASRAHDDTQAARDLTIAAEALVDASRPTEALDVVHRAEMAAARGGDRPEVRADVLESLGSVDVALSKFDAADAAYAEAMKLLGDHEPLDVAEISNNWANQLFERSDYARALPLSDRAVELLRKHVGDHHPDLARALQSNGNILMSIGRIADARARLEEALAIKRELFAPGESTVAMTMQNLALVHDKAGAYDKAAELLVAAEKIWLAKNGPDHAFTLMVRYNLGVNLRHRKKLGEALAMISDVLARRRALKPPPQTKIANALDELASIDDDLNKPAEAIAAAEEALAIRIAVIGPDTGDVAESLVKLAQLYGRRGDCAKALADAARAIAITAKMPGGDVDAAASPTIVIAACAARAGKPADAIAGYRKAIAMLAKATAEDLEERGHAQLEVAKLAWSTDPAAARAAAKAAVDDLAGDDRAAAAAWLAAH